MHLLFTRIVTVVAVGNTLYFIKSRDRENRIRNGGFKMLHVIDKFVLFIFDHPSDDIVELFNRFTRGLTEQELKELNVPLTLESGKSCRVAPEALKQAIIQDIKNRAGVPE